MKQPENPLRLYLALGAVGIIWGTTFLGMKIAVSTVPPWYVTGIRQSLATLLLFGILSFRGGVRWLGWSYTGQMLLISVLSIVLANGLTTVASGYLPSSIASLLTCTSPLLVFCFSILFGLQRFRLFSLVGIFLALGGISLVFQDGVTGLLEGKNLRGVYILAGGVLAWSLGSILSKRLNLGQYPLYNTLFYQFGFSAVIQLVLAWVLLPYPDTSGWSWQSLWAIGYLGIFGSVVAYLCFYYALHRISAIQVSMLTYVNTLIAVFAGIWVLDEPMNSNLVAATVLIILGVFLTNFPQDKLRRIFTKK